MCMFKKRDVRQAARRFERRKGDGLAKHCPTSARMSATKRQRFIFYVCVVGVESEIECDNRRIKQPNMKDSNQKSPPEKCG